MPSTPDWKKEAESKYERERDEIRAEAKSGFYFHVFLYILIGVVFGIIYVVHWMIVGGNFLPDKEAVWLIAAFIGGVPFVFLMERHDRIREVREQRLIRLEMKIDALLERYKP